MEPLAEHIHKQTSYGAKAAIEWDVADLLAWIKHKRPTLLDDDKIRKLREAEITGEVFLDVGDNDEFYENDCKLSVGTAVTLAKLSNELAEQEGKRNRQQAEDVGKKSGQVAGQKRKGDGELDLPATLEKSSRRKSGSQEDQDNDDDDDDNNDNDSKHGYEDDCLPQALPKLTRMRKRLVKEAIKKLDAENPIDHASCSDPPCSEFDLPGAVHCLSNPEYETFLPFPVVLPVIPRRYELHENEHWRFAGREDFRSLLKAVKMTRTESSLDRVWVYGTRGYGKSHLLAALVCYLTAKGERVVYIPDCRASLDDPVEYLKAAMLMAWTDKDTQDLIRLLDTEQKIIKFLERHPAVFVIDQMNALSTTSNSPTYELAAQIEMKTLINTITTWRRTVFSSSANNLDYITRQTMPNSEHTIFVYGGLTEAEKEQWWKRHPNLDLGTYTRDDIEDLTGNIPLLLDQCLQSGKLDMSPLREAAAKAVHFTRNVRNTTLTDGNATDWRRYCDLVQACLLHHRVSAAEFQTSQLIDRRFFFQEDNIGRYTCGVVRDAVANALIQYQE